MTEDERPPQIMAIGRRITPRVAANIPVRLHLLDREPADAYTRDIGTGGICVSTDEWIDPTEVQGVELSFPGHPVRVAAAGCWQQQAGDDGTIVTGLSFVDLTVNDLYVVWDFVQSRAQEIAKFLFGETVFEELDLADSLDLALASRLRHMDQGAVIYESMEQPARAASIYVVFRGAVRLSTSSPGRSGVAHIHLAEGQSFGGGPWLLGFRDRELASAIYDSMLLEVDHYALGWLESSKPTLLHRFQRSLMRIHHARAVDLRSDSGGEGECGIGELMEHSADPRAHANASAGKVPQTAQDSER